MEKFDGEKAEDALIAYEKAVRAWHENRTPPDVRYVACALFKAVRGNYDKDPDRIVTGLNGCPLENARPHGEYVLHRHHVPAWLHYAHEALTAIKALDTFRDMLK